jgi:hypothetical protein
MMLPATSTRSDVPRSSLPPIVTPLVIELKIVLWTIVTPSQSPKRWTP